MDRKKEIHFQFGTLIFLQGGGVWGGGDVCLFSHDVYKVNGQEKGDTLPGVTSMGVFSEYRSMFE